MTLLPVVERELRVAARRRGAFWTRFGVAAVGLLTAALIFAYAVDRGAAVDELGPVVFGVLTSAALVLCALAGVVTTADSLSEERREGTLGLLFLTDLRGYDIVLGKLAATGTVMSYALLGLVPVVALPLLLGGVSAQAVTLAALALGNALFFSLTAGLCVSAMARTAQSATNGVALLLLLFHLLLPVTGLLLAQRAPPVWWQTVGWALELPSPGATFVWALQIGLGRAPLLGTWWLSFGTVHLLAWAMLAFACWRTPRTITQGPARRGRDWWRRLRGWWRHGGAAARRAVRQRTLDAGPLVWQAAREVGGTRVWWLVLLAVGAFWAWGVREYGWEALHPATVTGVAFLVNGLFKLTIAGETIRRFHDDRAQGTLELLLTTPLTVRDLVVGHLRGLLWRYRGPLGVLLVAEAAHFALGLTFVDTREERLAWLFALLTGLVVAVADVFTLGWLGAALGLTFRRYSRAASTAHLLVLALPWGVFTAVVLTLRFLADSSPGGWEGAGAILLWGGICLATDWVLWKAAQNVLRHQMAGGFAAAAAQQRAKPG